MLKTMPIDAPLTITATETLSVPQKIIRIGDGTWEAFYYLYRDYVFVNGPNASAIGPIRRQSLREFAVFLVRLADNFEQGQGNG